MSIIHINLTLKYERAEVIAPSTIQQTKCYAVTINDEPYSNAYLTISADRVADDGLIFQLNAGNCSAKWGATKDKYNNFVTAAEMHTLVSVCMVNNLDYHDVVDLPYSYELEVEV